MDGRDRFDCICAPGYTGTICETEINECILYSPCENGGGCSDRVNGYECTCAPGWTGMNCDTDIEECISDPCQNEGACLEAIDGYRCNCIIG